MPAEQNFTLLKKCRYNTETKLMKGKKRGGGIVWRTSRNACLLCPWARHLTGRLHLYVADRWPAHTSPGYNCEVANLACRKRQLFSVRLVGGGATSH